MTDFTEKELEALRAMIVDLMKVVDVWNRLTPQLQEKVKEMARD